MSLTLRKSMFSRNQDRQKDFGEFFNKTSSSLNFIMSLVLTLFFTPVIVASSFLSKEIVLISVNVSLCLGYLSNFLYRCYKGEISRLDLGLSSLMLASFIGLGYFLCPPLGVTSILSVLVFANQIAIASNLFFMFKNTLVPPCMKMIKNAASHVGFKISDRYFNKPILSLDKDRYAIDRLLKKSYGHDSFSERFQHEELNQLNRLFAKLCEYINKYDEPLLGYMNNKEKIIKLETLVESMVTKGNSDSCSAFIQEKIDFKMTKAELLKVAKEELEQEKQDPYHKNIRHSLRFFKGTKGYKSKQPDDDLINEGLQCLHNEIIRQKDKITDLVLCKPGN